MKGLKVPQLHVFYEENDDQRPTMLDGKDLLAYARSHSAMELLIQSISDYHQCEGSSNHMEYVAERVDELLEAIKEHGKLTRYEQAIRALPPGLMKTNFDTLNDAPSSAHRFFSI